MRCKGGKGANSGAALNIISADGDRLGEVILYNLYSSRKQSVTQLSIVKNPGIQPRNNLK